MKASGNGAPEICVQNLLKTIRGEVPYERIKGLSMWKEMNLLMNTVICHKWDNR